MRFLVPAAAAGLVAVPAITLLYFLKVKGPEVKVASLLLWPRHLADRQANIPWKRLRISALLLAQLLVAVAAAFALMRPGLAGAAAPASTTVAMIDGSATMRATDVAPSRFEAAVGRVRRMADGLENGQKLAVVVLGQHAQLLAPATADRGSLRAALNRARPSGEAANLEEGISLANAIIGGRPASSVVLFSDGNARQPSAPPPLAAPLRYEPLGTSTENAAMEAVGRTPQGEIFLRAANRGGTTRDASIELRADGRLVDVLPIRLEAGSSVETTWPRLPADTQVLEARLAPADDFALDDSSWLVTAPPADRRVLVVTRGNGFLTRALSLRKDLKLTTVAPDAYRPGDYDLSIFDGWVPPGPLPSPAVVIAPPPGSGPLPSGPEIDPGGLLPASPREPLLQYVSLRDVHVQASYSVTVPDDWRVVVSGANGPLLLVHQGEPRLAQLTFDIHRSDLPLRAAFPVLLQNLVSQLLPGGFENQVLPLGRPVRIVTGPDTRAVSVTSPGGYEADLAPPYPATLEDTSQPGVYTVRQTGPTETVTSRFVVVLDDPEQSDIAPGERPLVRATVRAGEAAPRGTLEIWPWLVGLAIVGLLVEWVVYLRG